MPTVPLIFQAKFQVFLWNVCHKFPNSIVYVSSFILLKPLLFKRTHFKATSVTTQGQPGNHCTHRVISESLNVFVRRHTRSKFKRLIHNMLNVEGKSCSPSLACLWLPRLKWFWRKPCLNASIPGTPNSNFWCVEQIGVPWLGGVDTEVLADLSLPCFVQ